MASETKGYNGPKAEIKNGRLIIDLPFNPDGPPSASGKNRTVATTHGNQGLTMHNGQIVTIGVNAYVKA